MKQKLFSSLIVCVLVAVNVVYAQTRRIVGKVTDKVSSANIAGASIRAVGTNSATMTDAVGEFVFNAPADARQIEIKYIGYEPFVMNLTGTDTYNVQLTSSANLLDEVVIGAAGLKVRAREQGTQQTRINSAQLTAAKSPTVAGGLYAKVPGLQINAISSGVNPTFRLVLRGNRSLLGDNTALVVVDNSIVDNSVLGNLNPEDVEDVVVLNGAGAAALYGSKGSNGAILITTKKGKDGVTTVTATQTETFQEVSFFPKLQNEYGSGYAADGIPTYVTYENQQYGPRYDGSTVQIGQTLEDGSVQYVTYSPTKDRQDFWETGREHRTDFAISSGDERSTSYLSGQYMKTSGTTWKDEYDRFSLRANGSRKLYNSLRMDYNVNYTVNNYDITNQTSNIYNNLLNTPAHIPLLDYKDWRNGKFANPNGYYNNYYGNPYFLAENYRNYTKNAYLTGNAQIDWNPLEWLGFTARVNMSNRNQTYKNTTGEFTYSDYVLENWAGSQANIAGAVSDGSYYKTNVIGDFIVNANKKVQDFGFRLTTGLQISNTTTKSIGVSADGLVIPDLFNVSNRTATLPNGSESNSTQREVGIWGKLVVDYKNYLFLTVNGRNDWTSVLEKGNNSFFYPTADVSFIATDAIDALKNASWLNVLKLRAGASKSGNVNLDPYSLYTTFSQASGFPYASGPGFSVGGVIVQQGLQPEITTGYEGGFDATLYKNRINLGFTYYSTDTKNQIVPTGVSTATGYSTYRQNVGLVTNRGIETYLDLTVIQKEDFQWNLGGNYTWGKNKVGEISSDLNQVSLSSGGSAQAMAIKGELFPVLLGTVYNKDDQGRIIVDPITGYPSVASNSAILGNTQPIHKLGLNTNISYKGWNLSVVAEYRGGYSIYNNAASTYDFSGSSARTTEYNRERFVIPNSSYWNGTEYVDNTNITVRDGGAGFWASSAYNMGIAENYVYSGDFWKIREATLSYTVPARMLVGMPYIKRAQVSLQGRNLFIWVPKANIYTDPEYNFSDSNAMGITTLAQTPPTRYFGGSISLTF